VLVHTEPMPDDDLSRVAQLLQERNRIDDQIAAITERPMTLGHLGEWIAAQLFDIELEKSATTKALDGRFRSGPLREQTVNVKWYLKREGILDMTTSETLDYYLVMTGPVSAAVSSQGCGRAPGASTACTCSTLTACGPTCSRAAAASERHPASGRSSGTRPRSIRSRRTHGCRSPIDRSKR
jgi:hypothetical protein